jgi:hypothetical protein
MFADERIDFAPGWWKIPKPSLRHLAAVAARVASLMITSSSIERAFSVAGAIASKRRMRIAAQTLHAQLMVQANWSIAKQFLAGILALGPEAWHAEEDARIERTGIDPYSEDLSRALQHAEEEEDDDDDDDDDDQEEEEAEGGQEVHPPFPQGRKWRV